MMELLKTHLISLIAGVAGLIFVGVAAVGMTSDSVKKAMNDRLSQVNASQIGSLKTDPKNQKIISAEEQRGKLFHDEFEKTVGEAHRINRREPLLTGVFPKSESRVRPTEFVEEYNRAMERLPLRLIGGTLPTAAEVAEEQQNVNDLRALEAEKLLEGGGTEKAITGEGGAATPPPQVATREDDEGLMVGKGGGGFDPTGGKGGKGGGGGFSGNYAMASNVEPKYDPVARANVEKAKSIRCYVEPESFQLSPITDQTVGVQSADLWFAQVSYWIQQDVVEAVAKLNKAAAEQIKDGDAHVQHMPVKRIIEIRVFGYQLPDQKMVEFPAAQGSASGGSPEPSFTGRASNEQFDVVRFSVTAVVDQREVMRLIDQLTRENFYQCVDVGYQSVPATHTLEGYLYGTNPVVITKLSFEGYMARALYQPLMPPDVLKLLGLGEKSDE